MNVFNWLLFNSLLNFCLCLVYCNIIFIVQLCYFLANVIFTPWPNKKILFKNPKNKTTKTTKPTRWRKSWCTMCSMEAQLFLCECPKCHGIQYMAIVFIVVNSNHISNYNGTVLIRYDISNIWLSQMIWDWYVHAWLWGGGGSVWEIFFFFF